MAGAKTTLAEEMIPLLQARTKPRVATALGCIFIADTPLCRERALLAP